MLDWGVCGRLGVSDPWAVCDGGMATTESKDGAPQKVEGDLSFHTAMSTAFPQPAPGAAPSPGPMKVPAEKLRDVLGITHASFIAQKHDLAVVDSSLSGMTVEAHGSPAL